MKPFFIFRFFPFFRQIAKRKVLVFFSQCFAYYTTTRENRELRLQQIDGLSRPNYTTTRENRELRLFNNNIKCRQIIPLREKTGNYDRLGAIVADDEIIPLREKTGNYD